LRAEQELSTGVGCLPRVLGKNRVLPFLAAGYRQPLNDDDVDLFR